MGTRDGGGVGSPKKHCNGLLPVVLSEHKLDLTDERSLAFDVSVLAALLQAVEHIRDHSDKYLPNAWKNLAIILRSKY